MGTPVSFIKKIEEFFRNLSDFRTSHGYLVGGVFMPEEHALTKEQKENKIRCAQFLFDMFQKYIAEIQEEQKTEQKTEKK